MLRNEGERLQRVVVCTPSTEYALGSGRKEHNIGILGDPGLALQQHDLLKATLRGFGAEVLDIPEMAGHPNSVFTRDTALCTPRGYIKLKLGLDTRRGEEDWMVAFLEKHAETCAGEILPPGTVEGGDVVLAGEVAFIGQSLRTNAEGIRQFSAIMDGMGFETRVIPLPEKILHLDKVLMTLGPRQVLYCPEHVPEAHIRDYDGIGLDCGGDTTANIICLGERELVINRSNGVAARLLEGLGFSIHLLDLGEFASGMGGPNCLIMPVERGS
jgi:dimethylargininase